jgi:hypothetical protein
MSIRFECSHCKVGYEVADDLGGKAIMCRECQKRGQVPDPAVQSRRQMLLLSGGVLAAAGSIGTGIFLARRPWRWWSHASGPRPEGSDTTDRRGKGRGKNRKGNKGS